MNTLHPHYRRLAHLGLATVAATLVASTPSYAQGNADPATAALVIAQAPAGDSAKPGAANPDTGPVHLRGVRAAAKQGPDALRRYIHRTRMIHGFAYTDFAPKE